MKGKVNFPHECPEWDYLWICPGDPEFEACICESNDEEPVSATLK